MSKTILIKPVISEKSEALSEGLNQATFIVNKKANKIEIKKAVEEAYNVTVLSVNTINMPAKERSRFTKTGQQKGRLSAYKKAIVKLDEDDSVDFFEQV